MVVGCLVTDHEQLILQNLMLVTVLADSSLPELLRDKLHQE